MDELAVKIRREESVIRVQLRSAAEYDAKAKSARKRGKKELADMHAASAAGCRDAAKRHQAVITELKKKSRR